MTGCLKAEIFEEQNEEIYRQEKIEKNKFQYSNAAAADKTLM